MYMSLINGSQVLMFPNGSSVSTRNMSNGLAFPKSVFVTDDGNAYVDNGKVNLQVERWTPNATIGIAVMNVNSSCYSLFVDNNDTLYCSQDTQHRVIAAPLSAGLNGTTVVAGNGSAGSTPRTLNTPNGIFVDSQFGLYVADCYNDRIQRFKQGQLNGTTMAGNGTVSTAALSRPVALVLDGDGYMFIADNFNHRIVGSGPRGYRCLVGCSRISGSASNQLSFPRVMQFDNGGNLIVTDTNNGRVQKFLLASNCTRKLFPFISLWLATLQCSTSALASLQRQALPFGENFR